MNTYTVWFQTRQQLGTIQADTLWQARTLAVQQWPEYDWALVVSPSEGETE